MGSTSRANRIKKVFKEELKEAGKRSKMGKEAAAFWLEALNTSIMISIKTTSELLTHFATYYFYLSRPVLKSKNCNILSLYNTME